MVGNMIANGNYKTYVKADINDDKFLTLVGMIGSFGNGGGRFIWGIIYNFLGYRKCLIVVMIINIIIFGSIHSVVPIK